LSIGAIQLRLGGPLVRIVERAECPEKQVFAEEIVGLDCNRVIVEKDIDISFYVSSGWSSGLYIGGGFTEGQKDTKKLGVKECAGELVNLVVLTGLNSIVAVF